MTKENTAVEQGEAMINIDGVERAVASLSTQAQQLLGVFKEWGVKEAKIKGDLLVIQAAKRDLSREVIAMIKSDEESAETAEPAVPDVNSAE